MRGLVLAAVIGGFVTQAERASACEDLTLPLDETLQTPSSFSDALTRDTSLYMLKGIVVNPAVTVRDDVVSWLVRCTEQSPELMVDLASTVAFDGTLDPRRMREVFEARYLKTIRERSQDSFIKSTLAEFKTITQFEGWEQEIVEYSAVKRKTRRIFRSPESFTPAVSVSQTLETETGDPTAPVRETEVGVKRVGSEDWDFYAYDSAGKLSEVSTFPAGERPSPRICIACHYDAGTRAVERFFP